MPHPTPTCPIIPPPWPPPPLGIGFYIYVGSPFQTVHLHIRNKWGSLPFRTKNFEELAIWDVSSSGHGTSASGCPVRMSQIKAFWLENKTERNRSLMVVSTILQKRNVYRALCKEYHDNSLSFHECFAVNILFTQVFEQCFIGCLKDIQVVTGNDSF